MKKLLIIFVALPFLACAQNNNSFDKSVDPAINSYEDCVKAGNPVMRSLPPKCRSKDGRIFVKGQTKQEDQLCKDSCGDGTCQEFTCQAEGCPCHERHETCPSDCPK